MGCRSLVCVLVAALPLLGACGSPDRDAAFAKPSRPAVPAREVWTQLPCGGTTYRIRSGKLTGVIDAACEELAQAVQTERGYRATIVRFTCRDTRERIVQSLLVPSHLLDQYESNCREYLAAQDAFESALRDRSQDHKTVWQTHRAEASRFNTRTNELAKAHLAEMNDLARRTRADREALEHLIKDAGGSIEIAG